jgi:peptide/nickel transport system ATP-binding protein
MAIDNRNPRPDHAAAPSGAVPPGSEPPAAGPGEVLRLEDVHVSVHHGAATAVRGVSLRVRPGEIVGLVGESGSGKTLTCRAALGVLPPGCEVERGSVSFAGREVTTLSRRGWEDLHGSQMGAVFQDPASYLNPVISVGHQLAEVLRVKLGLRRRAAHQRTLELFEAVGLRQPERVFHQIPAELSGGMLQRVMIAIAISCDPQLLVADEPTTALDVTIQAEVLELLQRLRDERGLAVLFVSHDLAVITQLCDRIAVFYAGEIVESGPAEEIIRQPRHPYTQALLRVASVGDFRRRELEVIAGQPPQVGEAITGCRFAARCPAAVAECGAGPVSSVLISSGPDSSGPADDEHHVRCVHAGRAVVAS